MVLSSGAASTVRRIVRHFVYVCVCRYKAAGILRLYNKLVTLRLLWALDHVPGLREAANKGGGYHDKVAIQ